MRKIKVIVKRPDERYGHVCNISDSLKNLQNTVGGYIEAVEISRSVDERPILLICNEEGKLRNLPTNMYIGDEEIVGTIIICSAIGEDFAGLPDTFTLHQWKELVDENT